MATGNGSGFNPISTPIHSNGSGGKAGSAMNAIVGAKILKDHGYTIASKVTAKEHGDEAARRLRLSDIEAELVAIASERDKLTTKLAKTDRVKRILYKHAQNAWGEAADLDNPSKPDHAAEIHQMNFIAYATTVFGFVVASGTALTIEQSFLASTIAVGSPGISLAVKAALPSMSEKLRRFTFHSLIPLAIGGAVSFTAGFVGRYAMVQGFEDFTAEPPQYKALMVTGILGIEVALASFAFYRAIDLKKEMWDEDPNHVYHSVEGKLRTLDARESALKAERVAIKRASAEFLRRVQEENEFLKDFNS